MEGDRGRGGREGWTGSLGLVDSNILHIECIINKVLLYSTGKYIHYPGINHNEKESEKEYIYTYLYIQLKPFAVHQKLTKLCKLTILQ